EAAQRSMSGAADLALALGRRAVLVASGRAQDNQPGVEAVYTLLLVGPAQLWIGRRPLGFGAATGGGSVLNAGVPFDGAGIFTRPLHPGSVLRLLGPLRLEAFGSRLRRTGGVADPWFAAARVWLQPHPRLSLAGTRAAALGGQGNTAVGWSELPAFLLGGAGGQHGETENQVASLEARWRVPAGALPLVAYGEWAMDDMGMKLLRNSGLVAGVELAALPGAPGVALGLEHAGFPDHCCGFPPWYRHSALPWIEERVPLGRPLGGAGSEWLLHSRADLRDARLRLEGKLIRRNRLADNLYAPTRQGVSTGGEMSVEWMPGGAFWLYGYAALERGSGWRQDDTGLGVKVRM
ncbi:MAG TPA: capsule assembly Wzi family protein, partial [Longimicrobiales bacterium]